MRLTLGGFAASIAVASVLAAQSASLESGIAHFDARRWFDAHAFFADAIRAQPGSPAAAGWLIGDAWERRLRSSTRTSSAARPTRWRSTRWDGLPPSRDSSSTVARWRSRSTSPWRYRRSPTRLRSGGAAHAVMASCTHGS